MRRLTKPKSSLLNNIMKNICISIAILVILVIILAGCSKTASQTSPSTQAIPSITTSESQSSPSPSLTITQLPVSTPSSTSTGQSTLQTGLPLQVTEPADAANLTTDMITVKGQTQPGATINVNDQVDTADENGNFSVPVNLQDGPNVIDVIASDDNGNQGEVLLMVNVDLSQSGSPSGSSTPTSTLDSQGNLILKVTSPIDGAILNANTVTVTGQNPAKNNEDMI